jgi:hypothetical protein
MGAIHKLKTPTNRTASVYEKKWRHHTLTKYQNWALCQHFHKLRNPPIIFYNNIIIMIRSGGLDEDDFEVPLKEDGRRVSTWKEASPFRRYLSVLANEANFMMAPADPVMAIPPAHNWAAQQQDQTEVEVQLKKLSGGLDEDDLEVPLKEEGRHVTKSKEASPYRRDLLLSSEIDVTESLKGHHCHEALHNFDGDASMLVTRSFEEGSPYRVEMLPDNMGNFSSTLTGEWDDDHTCVSEADIDDESSKADFVDALKDHTCHEALHNYDGGSSMIVVRSSKEGSTYRMDILLDNMRSFSMAEPLELTCVSEGDIDDDESECLIDDVTSGSRREYTLNL